MVGPEMQMQGAQNVGQRRQGSTLNLEDYVAAPISRFPAILVAKFCIRFEGRTERPNRFIERRENQRRLPQHRSLTIKYPHDWIAGRGQH